MLLLGLDTATRRVGVVLANEHGMLGRVELGGTAETAPPRHAETLAPAIAWCCEQCGVELAQLSAIAVGIGPGMFTGLRVGVTTAKVLAQSLRIPVIPVPSLDLLAYPLRYARRLVVATIDARRHELYWAIYRQVPGGVQRVSGVRARDARRARRRAAGARRGRARVRRRRRCVSPTRSPRSAVTWSSPVLRTRRRASPRWPSWRTARYEREDFCPPAEVLPMYLRRSDAELAWDRKGRADGRRARDRRRSTCTSRRCAAGTCAASCGSRRRCTRARGRTRCS